MIAPVPRTSPRGEPSGGESVNERLFGIKSCDDDLGVDHILGAHARYCRGADVVDPERQTPEHGAEAHCEAVEFLRPLGPVPTQGDSHPRIIASAARSRRAFRSRWRSGRGR